MNKILISVVACLSVLSSSFAQNDWTTIRAGLETREASFVDNGQTVTLILVRVDPRRNSVRVIDMYHELGKAGGTLAAYSLKEAKRRTGAVIAVNAGSTASYSLPVPVGLLQVGGRIVNRINLRALMGGILCINRDRVSITPVSANVAVNCIDAVQRGPYISSDAFKPEGHDQRYRRTVASVDNSGRLLILVTRQGSTLSGLASFLFSPQTGLSIQKALNLDGDRSSGLLVTRSDSEVEVGSTDALIASAIVIQSRN